MAKQDNRRHESRHTRENTHDTNGQHTNDGDCDDEENFIEWRAKWRHTLTVLAVIGAVVTTILGWIVSLFALIKEYGSWHK